MRALVVSNAEATRKSLGEILSKVDFQVFTAGDLRTAMEILSGSWPLDLALLDWSLPSAGGLRLVRTIRSSRDHDSLRLVMVTSRLEMTQVFEAIRAGVDDYLTKPVTRKKILEKLVALRFYTA
jgi:two-component system chemotaxis response regulator CheY